MKVECIKDMRGGVACLVGQGVPVLGGVYHIREVVTRSIYGATFTGYLLVEVVNAPRHWADGFCEIAFDRVAFRPITDISTFTKFTKVRELEDV